MILHAAIVIRPDGSVPFDDDLHPDHKAHMVAALIEMGHDLRRATDGTYKIENFQPDAMK